MSVQSINELRASLLGNGGIPLANRFFIELPAIGSVQMPQMNLLCKAMNMPGKQITTVDRQINGTLEKVAYSALWDEVTLTFHPRGDFLAKKYFEEWQNMTFDMSDERVVYHKPKYREEYEKDVYLYQVNKDDGEVSYGCKLLDAFPTSINAIGYNDDNKQPVELQVQITYRRWANMNIT